MEHIYNQAEDQPSYESPSAGQVMSTKAKRHTPTSEPANDRRLPFVSTVLRYTPKKEIVVERVLNLNEDLYLRDHLFVHAPDIKPLFACRPVMPMTFCLEAIAEVAACLTPGFGVIGFEDVKATHWIRMDDVETLVLRISAQLADYNPETVTYSITGTIFGESEILPAVSATVLLGQHYLQTIAMEFEELIDPRPYPLKAEEIYRERHLFHGPAFQCVSGDMVLGDQGLTGELTVLPKERLFATTKTPELLTDPIALDGAAQLLGLWGQNHNRYILPISIQKLEIYCPTPPVGTRVPVRLQITDVTSRRVHADIEIQDGTGHVWMRIRSWGDWIFHWTKKVFDFQRLPTKYVWTRDIYLPHLPQGSICQAICTNDLREFDLRITAGYYLHMDESDTFSRMDNHPVRQREWLLGRIVAKDAVRLWLAQETASDMLHPAIFVIENDSQGQPVIKSISEFRVLPHISLAHSSDRAIAVASRYPTGIDLEFISHRDIIFLESFATTKEQDFINGLPMDERDIWITRLWCAKEAVSKTLGSGLSFRPQSFELHHVAPDGCITIHHNDSDRLFTVHTRQDQGFIIAYTMPQEI